MTVSPSSQLREAGSPPPARRRPRRRPSASHLGIAAVMILAFILNLLVLQDRGATTLVALADRPLAAGSTLEPAALRLVPVDSGFEGLEGLLTEDEIDAHRGWVLNRSIQEGGVVQRTDLAPPGAGPGLGTMSLPVAVEHAAGGSLSPGDRVDVIAVIDGVAAYVARDLEVVSVGEPAGAGLAAPGSYHVVVAVTASQALDLAEALATGTVELVRATGSRGGS